MQHTYTVQVSSKGKGIYFINLTDDEAKKAMEAKTKKESFTHKGEMFGYWSLGDVLKVKKRKFKKQDNFLIFCDGSPPDNYGRVNILKFIKGKGDEWKKNIVGFLLLDDKITDLNGNHVGRRCRDGNSMMKIGCSL